MVRFTAITKIRNHDKVFFVKYHNVTNPRNLFRNLQKKHQTVCFMVVYNNQTKQQVDFLVKE